MDKKTSTTKNKASRRPITKKAGKDKGGAAKKSPAPSGEAREVKTKAVKKVNCQLPGAELLEQGKTVEEVMAVLEKELTPAQERFCREYIRDDNGTRAYLRSHPSASYETAKREASRLLTSPTFPHIQSRIEELRTARNKRLEISGDKVLRRLEARANVNPADLYDADGQFIPIHELDPDVALGIKSFEVHELFAGVGDQKQAIGLVRKIVLHDGKAADELLGRNLKLWKETGSSDNPIEVVHRIELVEL